jgi:hypothetical protein
MSATDNIDKLGDSQAQTEGDTLQHFAEASLNQSDSPTASEKNDAAEAKEDLDSTRFNRKRKAQTLCQICQVILKDEKPYYQVSSLQNFAKRGEAGLIITTSYSHFTDFLLVLLSCSGTEFAPLAHRLIELTISTVL